MIASGLSRPEPEHALGEGRAAPVESHGEGELGFDEGLRRVEDPRRLPKPRGRRVEGCEGLSRVAARAGPGDGAGVEAAMEAHGAGNGGRRRSLEGPANGPSGPKSGLADASSRGCATETGDMHEPSLQETPARVREVPESARDATPDIVIRNTRFDLSDVPPQWHPSRVLSLFFDNLSIFFPAGERFFIRSVQAYRDEIDEPMLRAEVRGFSGQEAIHMREHRNYNAMIAARGHDVEAMEARVVALLGGSGKRLSRRWRLAITCALEHHTALLGDIVLHDETLFEGAHPTMAALWRWHAAEENEHKGVAFDVYEATGGGRTVRNVAMVIVSLIFWAKIGEHQVRMMRDEGIATDLREWLSLGRELFGKRRIPSQARPFLRYFRRDFHPWEHDNREALHAWREQVKTA